MTLAASGQISLAGVVTNQSVGVELGAAGTAQISFNDLESRTLAGVLTTNAQLSMSDFYGKTAATFGTLWNETDGSLGTVGVEKITYVTSTYSASSITYTALTLSTLRFSTPTVGLFVGNDNASSQTKTTECYGTYFATLTRVSFAAQASVRQQAPSIRYGTLGWGVGGTGTTSAVISGTVEYNLATLTNADIANGFTYNGTTGSGTVHGLGGDGVTYGYIFDVTNTASPVASVIAKWTNATKAAAYTAVGGIGTNNSCITAPYSIYVNQSGAPNSGFKFNKATDTSTALNLAVAPFNTVLTAGNGFFSGHDIGVGHYGCSSRTCGYMKQGKNFNGTAYVNYTYGYYITYATDTWTTAQTIYVTSGYVGNGGAGLDPTFTLPV